MSNIFIAMPGAAKIKMACRCVWGGDEHDDRCPKSFIPQKLGERIVLRHPETGEAVTLVIEPDENYPKDVAILYNPKTGGYAAIVNLGEEDPDA